MASEPSQRNSSGHAGPRLTTFLKAWGEIPSSDPAQDEAEQQNHSSSGELSYPALLGQQSRAVLRLGKGPQGMTLGATAKGQRSHSSQESPLGVGVFLLSPGAGSDYTGAGAGAGRPVPEPPPQWLPTLSHLPDKSIKESPLRTCWL